MYREFVEIINLKEDSNISSFTDDDLFLKSSILKENQALDNINDNAYKSNSFNALSIIQNIFSKPRTITKNWEFSIPGRPPTISVEIDPFGFVSAILSNTHNRRDAIYLSGGEYTQRTSDGYDAISSSLSVSQFSITNLDYANRIAAWIYDDIINRLSNIIEIQKKRTFVGQIIHTTKLSTKALVKNVYGQDTDWIQHVGYTLRGTDSNAHVVFNDNKKTAGDNGTRTMPLINHSHSVSHTHDFSVGGGVSVTQSIVFRSLTWKGQGGAQKNGGAHPFWSQILNSGSSKSDSKKTSSYTILLNNKSINDSPLDIRQPYKNVYIWERIS